MMENGQRRIADLVEFGYSPVSVQQPRVEISVR